MSLPNPIILFYFILGNTGFVMVLLLVQETSIIFIQTALHAIHYDQHWFLVFGYLKMTKIGFTCTNAQ